MGGNQTDDVGILKSIWKKNQAGKWIIHDMQGVDLKPRDGYAKDYFKIKNEMVLLTERPGPIFSNLFSSFGMTEYLVRQSIVPIVAWNDGDEEMRCIGTGFFISATGYLLTAGHVLRDPVDEKYASENLHFGILLPSNPAMRTAPFVDLPDEVREAKWFMCPFEWAYQWGKDVESPLIHQQPEFKLQIELLPVLRTPSLGVLVRSESDDGTAQGIYA
ncbi:MAG: hypothetical protein U1E03_13325 [Hyphomonadaceae bacterium]